jgi:hypothetical protein
VIAAARAFRILLPAAVLGLLPAPAAAEWHIAPFIGVTFNSDSTIVDFENARKESRWAIGGSVTLIGEGPVGVETIFVYVPNYFGGQSADPILGPNVASSRSYALMGNVVLAIPKRLNEYGLRPFFSGGIGLLNAYLNEEGALDLGVNANVLGYNLGGGAVGFLTDRTGLRFDLRYYGTARPTEGLAFGGVSVSYWTASVGVVFRP